MKELKPILIAAGIIGALASVTSIIEGERNKKRAKIEKARLQAKLDHIEALLMEHRA